MIGLERVYAAGDVSSPPFKQGAFATQQGDAVAEAIAAALGAVVAPPAAAPQMRAVLWTGRGPRYLCGGNGGGGNGVSDPSQRHLELLHNGRLAARYLTPLVDSLLAGNDSREGERALAEAPQRS